MDSRISQIALRIALILEEFTEEEILKAVDLLNKKGSTSSLLEFLNKGESKVQSKQPRTKKQKPIEEQASQVLINLAKKDPEKHEILSEFDLALRKGKALSDLKEIRKLGEKLNKSFPSVHSRREAISKLMIVLVEFPITEIKKIIMDALSLSDLQGNEYQELAKYIINGTTRTTPEG